MEPSEQDLRFQRAKKHVEEIKSFYAHLGVFLVFNAGIFLVDLLTGGGWWFYWPLVWWGACVVIHGFTVFVGWRFFGEEWMQRKIREQMDHDARSGTA
jgi:hypothetical protein